MSAVMVKENLCLNAFKQNSQEKMREYEPYFWQACKLIEPVHILCAKIMMFIQ